MFDALAKIRLGGRPFGSQIETESFGNRTRGNAMNAIPHGTLQVSGNGLDPGRQWYVIRVKPQHERTVSYALQKKGFDRYVPLYKTLRRWSASLKELELPIFSGYVFCRMAMIDVAEVLATPAVYQLVARAGALPEPIEEPELLVIQRVESAGLPVVPWPYLNEGRRVRIAQGPLSGITGLLAASTKTWHVVVNVELLQRGIAVAVNRDDLVPQALAASV